MGKVQSAEVSQRLVPGGRRKGMYPSVSVTVSEVAWYCECQASQHTFICLWLDFPLALSQSGSHCQGVHRAKHVHL